MPDFHDVYATMKSLDFKMKQAGERTRRLGCIVAHEQNSATAMLEEPVTRAARRRHAERTRFWQAQVRRYGWQDGLTT